MSLGDFLDPTLKRKAGVGAGAYRPPGGGGSGRYSSSSRGGGSSFGGASFGEDAAPLPTGPRDRSGGGFDDRGRPIRREEYDDENPGEADLVADWRGGGSSRVAERRDDRDDRRGGGDRYDDRRGGSDRYDDRRGGSDRYDDRRAVEDPRAGRADGASMWRRDAPAADPRDSRDSRDAPRRGGSDRYDPRDARRGGGDRYDPRDAPRRGGSDRYDPRDARDRRGGAMDRDRRSVDAPPTRRPLQLQRRTAAAAPAAAAPAAASPAKSSKSNPFGAARPVLTKDAAEALAEAKRKEEEGATDDKWSKAFKGKSRRAPGGAPRANDRFAKLAEQDRDRPRDDDAPRERAADDRFAALAEADRDRPRDDDDAPPARDTGAAERFAALADPDRNRDDDDAPPARDAGAAARFAALADPDRNRDDDVSGGRVSPVDPANNRFARVAASAPREADFERPRNEEAFASFAYPRRRDDDDRRGDRDDYDRRGGRDDYDRRGGRDDYDRRGGRDDYDRRGGRGGRDDYDRRGGRDDYDRRGGRDDYDRRGGSEREEPYKRTAPRLFGRAGAGGAGRAAAAPPAGPTGMDDPMYVNNLVHKTKSILDIFVANPSLTAEDEAMEAFAKLGEPKFYPHIVTQIVLRAPVSGDSRIELNQLADLLLTVRKAKPALLTLSQFMESVESGVTNAAVAGKAAAESSVVRVLERFLKKADVPKASIPNAVTALLGGESSTGTDGGAGAGAGAGASPAAAAATATPIDALVAKVVASGKKGEAQQAFAAEVLEGRIMEAAGPVVEALLKAQKAAGNLELTTCETVFKPEEQGAMLEWLLYDSKKRSVAGLRAVIRVVHEIGFPSKGLLEAMFLHLYNHDIIAEESFVAWKNDYEDETPGRRSAIIELTRWFQWLDSLEDEESSDEDEDDDDE